MQNGIVCRLSQVIRKKLGSGFRRNSAHVLKDNHADFLILASATNLSPLPNLF